MHRSEECDGFAIERKARALVTGSSAGIGGAIARAMAAEGTVVIVHGRNEQRAKAVAKEIQDRGGYADVVLGDLSTDDGTDGVVKGALALGPVDILINNAGSYDPTTWETVTPKQWVETYQSDVISALRLVQPFMPGMKERG